MPFSKSGPGSRSAAPPKAALGKVPGAQSAPIQSLGAPRPGGFPHSGTEKQKPAGVNAGDTVYFEFIPAGSSMRVTAIDAKTGTEATIIGPANAARTTLERTALSKLRYVLNRAK